MSSKGIGRIGLIFCFLASVLSERNAHGNSLALKLPTARWPPTWRLTG